MYKKTEYERLKEHWYAKLKESGFKDIEQSDGSINVSKIRNRQSDEIVRQAIQEYYCMATYFLNEYEFDSEIEKVMWEYHTNGISIRNIVKILNKVRHEQTSRTVVGKTLKRLENIMKGLYLSV